MHEAKGEETREETRGVRMANLAEEAKSAVHEFYSNLLELLPIDKLVDRFISRKLLSFDRKSMLDSSATTKEKTRHFLDDILIPGLNIGFTEHFKEMVAMMKKSDDVLIKYLAEKLIPRVSATLTTDTSRVTNAGTKWIMYCEILFNLNMVSDGQIFFIQAVID